MNRSTFFVRASAVALAAAASMSGGQAFAQAAAPDTGVQALEEVVVTARRREERIQDVPVAVTAVSGESLRQANITQVQDIQQKAPGLTIQSSSFGSNVLQVAIRGQRQFDAYITKDPAVAVYFADVVQNRPQGLNSAMFDLESVQVLKGPQGTLFGRNTTGGAMIITPVAPSEDFEGYVTGGIGNYDARRLEGAINIPVNDWLQIRAAGSVTRREGFTKNITTGQKLDDDHKDNWRLSFRLTPVEGLENRLVLSGFNADENGVGYKLIGIRNGTPAVSLFPGLRDELALLAGQDFHTTTADMRVRTDIETFGLSNITEYELTDAITLKNIFGYRKVNSFIQFDLDGSRYPIFPSQEDMQVEQYSNELQLLGSAFDDRLNYIVGAYYFTEEGKDIQNSVSLGASRITVGDPIENLAYSAFAQVTYKPEFLEGLSLTVGGRQNHDERKLTSRNTTAAGVCRLTNATGGLLNPCAASFSQDYDKFTYSVSADYRFNPGLLVYVAHRLGYRTGGFNISATTPAQFTPFRPEEVSDIEVGLKSDWNIGGVQGRFNLAVYSQDYQDIQRNQGFFLNGVFVQSIVNAASARINGFEAELTVRPTDYLELGANVSHIDAKYKNWIDPLTRVDLSGSQFVGAPEWTFSGNASVTVPLSGDAGELVVRGDVYYQTESNNSDNNFDQGLRTISPTSVLDEYTLVNARVEWREPFGKAFTAAAFAKNLLDEEYYAGGTDLAPSVGITGNFMGAPRTYGVELTYRF